MNTKLFTILDEGTKTYVMADKLDSNNTAEEDRILEASGWGNRNYRKSANYVILVPINGGVNAAYNNFADWNSMTYVIAHRWIKLHFDDLNSGDVIDVENIKKDFGIEYDWLTS